MKNRGSFCLITIYFLCFPMLIVNAQIGIVDRNAKVRPTFVLVGTYHMGKQGNNVLKGKVDDITSPERQKQLGELVERLKEYEPTKIAIECGVEDDPKMQEKYSEYLMGTYELTKNETNQIGFRMAKEFKHNKLYCVDSGGGYFDSSSYNYEKYAAKDPELDKFLKSVYAKGKKRIDAEHEEMFDLSIINQLTLINQAERIEKDHQFYFDLMRIGRGDQYVGANYLSWWYGRNMRILMNIIRITESPNDRILVIYGSGHSKLLIQFAKESGFYRVESPLDYLKKK